MKRKQLPLKFSPEIEARREAYQRVAESMITMLDVAYRNVGQVLDINPPGWAIEEPRERILYGSIDEHLQALFEMLLVTYKADFLRTLYVDLRLYYDQSLYDLSAGDWRHLKRKKGGGR